MIFGVINLNYSKDDEGKFEEDNVSSLFRVGLNTDPNSRQYRLAVLQLKLNKGFNETLGDYRNIADEEYRSACQGMIELIREYNVFSKQDMFLVHLKWLHVQKRLTKIKSQIDRGVKVDEALKPYTINVASNTYANMELFQTTEAEINHEVFLEILPIFQSVVNEARGSSLDYSGCRFDLISWVMKQFTPDTPQGKEIFKQLLLNNKNGAEGNDVFGVGLEKVLQKSFTEMIAQEILANEPLLIQIHEAKRLRFFFKIILTGDSNLAKRLLENINYLNSIARCCQSDPEFVFGFMTKLGKDFFRRALQAGFNYQLCISIIKTDFIKYKNEAANILYEALARGDVSTAKELLGLSKIIGFKKNKHKEITFLYNESKQLTKAQTKTNSVLTPLEARIEYSTSDLLQYLEEKSRQARPAVSKNTATDFFSTSKQGTLYFIDNHGNFIAMLMELKILSPENSVEFKQTFYDTFKLTPVVKTLEVMQNSGQP